MKRQDEAWQGNWRRFEGSGMRLGKAEKSYNFLKNEPLAKVCWR